MGHKRVCEICKRIQNGERLPRNMMVKFKDILSDKIKMEFEIIGIENKGYITKKDIMSNEDLSTMILVFDRICYMTMKETIKHFSDLCGIPVYMR